MAVNCTGTAQFHTPMYSTYAQIHDKIRIFRTVLLIGLGVVSNVRPVQTIPVPSSTTPVPYSDMRFENPFQPRRAGSMRLYTPPVSHPGECLMRELDT